ncbi:hypothetical protein AVEN_58866-1 [Araneus ventricosus]|uniref:HAT C-terminal dimerisation domain-containing protein n=1 Tax=Araneus ventricosus TaxID=182803 RepID=A0A4Y2N235_ARAVE|nr:hypothetical protein AVEN_58866-1 [Araneus ventricosus]
MDTVTKEISASYETSRKRKTENIHINRTVAAREICDVISNQVKNRFCFIFHYFAVSLLEAPKFQEYEKKFPTQILDQTTDIYSMLQKDRLKTELGVIYRRSDFRNMTGAISLLQFIIQNNLQTTFSQTYKLLLIIVTIPMSTAEAERCCSTLKRVKTFLRRIMSEDRLSALAMLSIEKGIISDIPKFNENCSKVRKCLSGARKCDLKILAEELGEMVNDSHKLKDLKKIILASKEYDEESAKEWMNTIISERKEKEEIAEQKRQEEIAEQKRQEVIAERRRQDEIQIAEQKR